MLIIIGILLLIALTLFVGGGLLGWLLKCIEFIIDFLAEGCGTTMGCLFWVFIGFVLLIGILL